MAASYRNLAPDIVRQRLLIEGFWTIEVNESVIRQYLLDLAQHLDLRVYSEPVIFAPSSGMGREDNAGWDAFVPLIDSGISGYFWARRRFLSVVLYTCKEFDGARAVDFTRAAFGMTDDVTTLAF